MAWAEFLFARCIFGYGERLLRPVFTALFVILCCSVIYTFGGVVTTGAGGTSRVVDDFFTALYFSIVTFTTLGYGDFSPSGGLRFVAAAEAFFGAALMALFVVSLARKYTR